VGMFRRLGDRREMKLNVGGIAVLDAGAFKSDVFRSPV
jgi:hypothetical protein